jgi:hypothetical protein
MEPQKSLQCLISLSLLILFVSACSAPAAVPTPTAVAPAPTATVLSAVPTDTPTAVPPTDTLLPTDTAISTPTATLTLTPTATATATSTSTATSTPTRTVTRKPTAKPTPTKTLAPTLVFEIEDNRSNVTKAPPGASELYVFDKYPEPLGFDIKGIHVTVDQAPCGRCWKETLIIIDAGTYTWSALIEGRGQAQGNITLQPGKSSSILFGP